MKYIYLILIILLTIIFKKNIYEKFSTNAFLTKLNEAKVFVEDYNNNEIEITNLNNAGNINVKGNLVIDKKITVSGGGNFNSLNNPTGRYIFQNKNRRKIRVGAVDGNPGIFSIKKNLFSLGSPIKIKSNNKIIKFQNNTSSINGNNLNVLKIKNTNFKDYIKVNNVVHFTHGDKKVQGNNFGDHVKISDKISDTASDYIISRKYALN